MSKRKGVSADEKRSRMLELFYEKKEFFQLKELEKIAPKEKGIIAQSVKDVIQNLVDDGLIDTDKIGTSVYFWTFPSKARIQKKHQLEKLREDVEVNAKKLKRTEDSIAQSMIGREDTEERNILLDKISDLQLEIEELSTELAKYKDNDPEALEKMEKEIQLSKEAANRWTDNIYSVKSWCKNKFNIEESVLDKQFQIPADFDYLE